MKYIVTGAAGLIGGAVVSALNQQGETDILAVDHLGTSEKWMNLRPLKFSDYLEKDLFRRRLNDGAFRNCGIEAIIHMGACSSTTERDASYLADNNFNVTKELAEFAVRNNIRFLYASSAATYGGGEHGYVDDEDAMDQLRPLNMYGYSKLMFDLWAKRCGLLDSITGMKFTNVFGPNEKHKGGMRSMVLRAFEQITETGKVKLFKSDRPEYADGEQKRDFIYVKDVAQMILALMRINAKGIYNIGSGRAETWNELVTEVFHALGRTPEIEYIDMPETLKGKYQYYTCVDMTKFHALNTGFAARPLSVTVADYVRNHLIPENG